MCESAHLPFRKFANLFGFRKFGINNCHMIKFDDIKEGDLVVAEFEGEKWEGVVKELNKEEKEICVETDVQQFWFTPEHLYPIPLDEEQLIKLNFQKQENGDNSVKYMKGAFRILVPKKDNFSELDIWWREDRRHLTRPISVHELQNHHYQMTKVELNRD